MKLSLVDSNDPILRTECEKFDFTDPPIDPVDFAHNLVKFMHEHNGLGLAANQVGHSFRVFAMRGDPENFVCYNPRIVDLGEEIVMLEESCLSYPGLIVPIKRYKSVKIRFQAPNSEVMTKKFSDLTARVVQHELMHLNGKLFWEGVSRLSFERARKKSNTNITYNGLYLEKNIK